MDKNAQGLSINVIIIVAIALIVLVVLIAIFTGRLGSFVKGLDESNTCANACKAIGKSTDSKDAATCTGGTKLPGTKESDCCCK